MLVTVFGAKGRTGRLVVEELLRAGHTVVAASRSGEATGGTRAVAANPVTGEGVADAVETCDAVVCALTSGPGNPACSALVQAILDRDRLRYLSIGGGAMDHPGDRKGLAHAAVSWLMQTAIERENLADRKREHDLMVGSRLRWTMLRPPWLANGPPLGRVRMSDDTMPGPMIRRADLAAAIVQAIPDESLIGRAPFVSN